jgi:rhamnulokinase
MPAFVAVDLGATSGRVVHVTVDADRIALDEVRRFPNAPRESAEGLVWNLDGLLHEIGTGVRAAAAKGAVRSVAVDSWGVDYGLLDEAGQRLGPVHAYRSTRTDGVMDRTIERLGAERIYAATGIQLLPFNTVYQLLASRGDADYEHATSLLMMPDLINHTLCGSTTNEITNASTTQLLDATTHRWHDGLVAELGLRRDLLPELHQPGTRLGVIGGVSPDLDGLPVIAAASHDTASAVAGTPLRVDRPAIYVSCGTWALVGCELPSAVTGPEARTANVTNELGVDRTIRLLKNTTGLWLLEQCRRAWSELGQASDLPSLLDGAATRVTKSVVDPDDPRFGSPGSMPEHIREACRASGQPVPDGPAAITRVILDSLALAWRATVATIERVAGFRAEVIHLVGGGAANELLARLCASACERPVLAGPVEATVVGNALVQAIADGTLPDLASGRALVERALPPRRIEPEPTLDWQSLTTRFATRVPT